MIKAKTTIKKIKIKTKKLSTKQREVKKLRTPHIF